MAKERIHISDKDAASDFDSVLARVREGAEVVIEHDACPVAVVRPAEPAPGLLLSESIALAEAHAKDSRPEPAIGSDFAADLKDIIKSRKPRDLTAWE